MAKDSPKPQDSRPSGRGEVVRGGQQKAPGAQETPPRPTAPPPTPPPSGKAK